MLNARTVSLHERANGKFTVVAEVYDEKERAWVRPSRGIYPRHEADRLFVTAPKTAHGVRTHLLTSAAPTLSWSTVRGSL